MIEEGVSVCLPKFAFIRLLDPGCVIIAFYVWTGPWNYNKACTLQGHLPLRSFSVPRDRRTP